MSGASARARMAADPEFAAAVRHAAAQAPPVTDEEIRIVRGILAAGQRELDQQARNTA